MTTHSVTDIQIDRTDGKILNIEQNKDFFAIFIKMTENGTQDRLQTKLVEVFRRKDN